MLSPYEIGKEGEQVAFRYLMKKAYRILAKHWIYKHKELDIVGTDGQWLIIFEVKTRVKNSTRLPIEAVDRKKQRNLCYAGDVFVRLHKIHLPVRYDVISIIYDPATEFFDIKHIENAFYPELRNSRSRYR